MGIKRLVRRQFQSKGYDIVPVGLSAAGSLVLERSLRLAGPISTIIDVGASDGSWTRSALRFRPRSKAILIEAQDIHKADLYAFAKETKGILPFLVAASDRDGELNFLLSGPLGGSASHGKFDGESTRLPCRAIDSIVRETSVSGPFLVKLDTHGHEVEILKGSQAVLSECALIIVEAYTFGNFGRMVFFELCDHMAELGFRPSGLSDPMVRPTDGLLWQLDLHFLRKDNKCFQQQAFQ